MTDSRPRTPRWVIVLAAVAATLALAFLVVHLTGNGMMGMHG